MLQVGPGTHPVNNIDPGEEAESALPGVMDESGRSDGKDGGPFCLKDNIVDLSDGDQ